jgi:hypothetical protein
MDSTPVTSLHLGLVKVAKKNIEKRNRLAAHHNAAINARTPKSSFLINNEGVAGGNTSQQQEQNRLLQEKLAAFYEVYAAENGITISNDSEDRTPHQQHRQHHQQQQRHQYRNQHYPSRPQTAPQTTPSFSTKPPMQLNPSQFYEKQQKLLIKQQQIKIKQTLNKINKMEDLFDIKEITRQFHNRNHPWDNSTHDYYYATEHNNTSLNHSGKVHSIYTKDEIPKRPKSAAMIHSVNYLNDRCTNILTVAAQQQQQQLQLQQQQQKMQMKSKTTAATTTTIASSSYISDFRRPVSSNGYSNINNNNNNNNNNNHSYSTTSSLLHIPTTTNSSSSPSLPLPVLLIDNSQNPSPRLFSSSQSLSQPPYLTSTNHTITINQPSSSSHYLQLSKSLSSSLLLDPSTTTLTNTNTIPTNNSNENRIISSSPSRRGSAIQATSPTTSIDHHHHQQEQHQQRLKKLHAMRKNVSFDEDINVIEFADDQSHHSRHHNNHHHHHHQPSLLLPPCIEIPGTISGSFSSIQSSSSATSQLTHHPSHSNGQQIHNRKPFFSSQSIDNHNLGNSRHHRSQPTQKNQHRKNNNKHSGIAYDPNHHSLSVDTLDTSIKSDTQSLQESTNHQDHDHDHPIQDDEHVLPMELFPLHVDPEYILHQLRPYDEFLIDLHLDITSEFFLFIRKEILSLNCLLESSNSPNSPKRVPSMSTIPPPPLHHHHHHDSNPLTTIVPFLVKKNQSIQYLTKPSLTTQQQHPNHPATHRHQQQHQPPEIQFELCRRDIEFTVYDVGYVLTGREDMVENQPLSFQSKSDHSFDHSSPIIHPPNISRPMSHSGSSNNLPLSPVNSTKRRSQSPNMREHPLALPTTAGILIGVRIVEAVELPVDTASQVNPLPTTLSTTTTTTTTATATATKTISTTGERDTHVSTNKREVNNITDPQQHGADDGDVSDSNNNKLDSFGFMFIPMSKLMRKFRNIVSKDAPIMTIFHEMQSFAYPYQGATTDRTLQRTTIPTDFAGQKVIVIDEKSRNPIIYPCLIDMCDEEALDSLVSPLLDTLQCLYEEGSSTLKIQCL